MATKLNLDALIPREDFAVVDDAQQSKTVDSIQIQNLENKSFFYPVLRKPDFQRETSDWSVEKVSDFIFSFLNGDLIPAIILWRSGSYIFAIDGAHRLSALLSWVHDDYGDGLVSQAFFDHNVPEEQVAIAEKARRLVRRSVGSYKDHLEALQQREKASPELLERATRLASLSLQLQWVTGDAEKAEHSFFKINQEAVPIDKTELRILQSRKKPNALSARAITRAGTGHKYWSTFEDDIQHKIEVIAKEINTALFTPQLRTPIKTLDLPVAGRGYSARTLSLVLELVNLANGVGDDAQIDDDSTGDATCIFLKKTRAIMRRISGIHPSSLGLHPVVYFYSAGGRYQPTAFLSVVDLIRTFDDKDYYRMFTDNRERFETFLLKYKTLPNQVTLKLGSGVKGFRRLHDLYLNILLSISQELKEADIIKALSAKKEFDFLLFEKSKPVTQSTDFSRETKSAVFLRDALHNPLRCQICNGLIHFNSIHVDHIVRKEDGGLGASENAQLTHPYCNSTYKN